MSHSTHHIAVFTPLKIELLQIHLLRTNKYVEINQLNWM